MSHSCYQRNQLSIDSTLVHYLNNAFTREIVRYQRVIVNYRSPDYFLLICHRYLHHVIN